MAQKKEGTEKKPGVKIQDLSPKKDAKGGARNQNATSPDATAQNKVSADARFADGGFKTRES